MDQEQITREVLTVVGDLTADVAALVMPFIPDQETWSEVREDLAHVLSLAGLRFLLTAVNAAGEELDADVATMTAALMTHERRSQ